MQVVEAVTQLKAAVSKSHPPTARYIVETAAVCLEHGLQASGQGFLLRPVAWSLVAHTVHTTCPHVADLLERLCGRTGQKYFQLLGNSESGEPEFVGANLDTLIISSQMPAVSSLLDQLHGRSQNPPAQHGDSPADVAPSIQVEAVSAPAGDTELGDGKEQESAAIAANQASHQLVSAPTQAVSSDRVEATKTVPRPTVVYAPPEPSTNSSSASTGSTTAMQALLSACMQVPTNSAGNSRAASTQLVSAPAVPAAVPLRPASASAAAAVSIPATTASARPASAAPAAQVRPVQIQNSTGSLAAADANGNSATLINSSSPSSNASSISQAVKARSSASTELSDASKPTADETTPLASQQGRIDPFCLECMAQPGQCSRHPLLAPPLEPMQESLEVEGCPDTCSPSDCSTQVWRLMTEVL